MLPTDMISTSKDTKNAVILLTIVISAATVIHLINQIHLAKLNREVAQLRIKEMEMRGITSAA